jgi:site-specific DNA-methyltransferase (cytosine-N4-specific)
LYKMAVGRAGHQPKVLEEKVPVGIAKSPRSLVQRAIRWHQQTLRAQGLITKVSGVRGVWELTQSGKEKLRKIKSGAMVLGFSTDLGIAVWGSCIDVFSNLDEPICLALTSPPYPLRAPRAYGNPPIEQYIDFMCEILEPIVKNLVTGGNIALSVSQDIFESQSPARSLYLEKLTLALCERLGLSLMDRIVWESNKPPGPLQWASKQRVQLNTGYEYVLWFTNDPLRCISDNRRVLEEHTPAHKKLIAQGGEKRECVNGDGAYRIRHGSYGNDTPGRIPRNVMHVSNVCSSQRQYKQRARELGLVAHGATMPLALARKLVRFLSDVGQLIVDPCGGSMTTALASELEGRAWASSEVVYDYVRGAAERFRSSAGFESSL